MESVSIDVSPVGNSPEIGHVVSLINQVANTHLPVLLTGETGVGKGVFAKYLHQQSQRANSPFYVVNCGSIAPTLLESELFGHEKGAFSGALSRRIGLLEHADKGTVLLDEINSASPDLQVRLLDFIQHGTIKRLGSNELIKPDVRLVFATNQSLEPLVEQAKFRADLYYRMQVFPIDIPPLRERRSDIPQLVDRLLLAHAQMLNISVPIIGTDVMDRLSQYNWPGNIRQLENVMQRLLLSTVRKGIIHLSDLPRELSVPERRAEIGTIFHPVDQDCLTLKAIEERHIKQMIARCEGNKSMAAKMLGINNSTLYRKLKELDGD